MKISKDNLFVGGATLAGGYLAASLLDQGIAHHIGCPAGCTPATCPTTCPPPVSKPAAAVKPPAPKPAAATPKPISTSGPCSIIDMLQNKCQIGDINKFAPPGTEIPNLPGGKGGPPLGGPDPACATTCGPSFSDPICNLNKVIHQCGGFNAECIPGVPIPCGIIFAAGAFVALMVVLKR